MTFRFKCSTCEDWHEGFPALSSPCPSDVARTPEPEWDRRVFLNSDFCVLDDRAFYIRCQLEFPVEGADEAFVWGIWSRVSEYDFFRYQDRYDRDNSTMAPMAGRLSNTLPDFPETFDLRLSVQPRERGTRPRATLEPADHPLALAQREGLPLDKVLTLIGPFLHGRMPAA